MKEHLLHSLVSARDSSISAPPLRGARDCSYRTPPRKSIVGAKLSEPPPPLRPTTDEYLNLSDAQSHEMSQRDRVYFVRTLVSVGVGKIVLGCILSGVGALCLLHGATLGYLAAGLWGGFCLILSGAVMLLASRYPDHQLYMVSCMCLLLVNLAVLGLTLLFSSTGVSRDYWRALDTSSGGGSGGGSGGVSETLILNSVVSLVAATDLLISLACVCLCTRHLCTWRHLCGDCAHQSRRGRWQKFGNTSVSDRLSHKAATVSMIPWQLINLATPPPPPAVLIPVHVPPAHYTSQPPSHHMMDFTNSYSRHSESKVASVINLKVARSETSEESASTSDYSAPYTARDRDVAEEFIISTMQTAPPTNDVWLPN